MDAALDDVFVDEISFPATDGYALTGTLFLPRGILGELRGLLSKKSS